MGESDTQSNMDDLLTSLDQDFEALQRHFAAQLSADIEYLKDEKERLLSAIAQLRSEYDDLASRYQVLKTESEGVLSEQQQRQQQIWAKRLAQVLARNLQDDLHAYVVNSNQLPNPTQDWLASFDSSLSQTVQSLQRDLSSYQSAMSQQLARMQSMEQQGEVILESLVKRLSLQLKDQMAQGNVIDNRPMATHRARPGQANLALDPVRQLTPPYPGRTVTAAEPAVRQLVAAPDKRGQRLQKGLVFSAIATLLLTFHTLLVGAISRGGELAGFAFAGFDSVTFLNASALLWLRLIVQLPLLWLLAPHLHTGVWADLQQWRQRPSRLTRLIGGGVCLFFSQVLMYQAVGSIGPAVAATLLFSYPLLAIPLGGWVQRDALSPLRWVVMGAIVMGTVLVARPALETLPAAGVTAALLSAVAFALYVTTMSLPTQRQVHPVSGGLVQFATMTVLSSGLLVFRPATLTQGIVSPGQFVTTGFGLGVITAVAYAFNYSGLRLAGGSRTALVAAITPLLTALLSIWLLTTQPALQLIQWTGIALITLGALTLSFDRLSQQRRAAAKNASDQTGPHQRRGRDSNPR
ncbi:MAG: EamA family transporter [Cyanobacteria bacterium J06626_23]